MNFSQLDKQVQLGRMVKNFNMNKKIYSLEKGILKIDKGYTEEFLKAIMFQLEHMIVSEIELIENFILED